MIKTLERFCKTSILCIDVHIYHLRKVHQRLLTLKCEVCQFKGEERMLMLNHYQQLHQEEVNQVDFLGYSMAGSRCQKEKEKVEQRQGEEGQKKKQKEEEERKRTST